jgi:hypothetical protein
MANNNDEYTFTPSSVDKMEKGKLYTVGSGDNERVSEFESKKDITEAIRTRGQNIKDNIKYYDLTFNAGRVVTVSDDPDDKDDVIKEATLKKATLKKQSGGRRRSYRKITVRKSRKNRNNNKSRRNSRKSRYSRRR